MLACFFFFNDTATTEIYTLSLHDALPICIGAPSSSPTRPWTSLPSEPGSRGGRRGSRRRGRKSTRLNSSHRQISYALFCLEKKTQPDLSKSQIAEEPAILATLRATQHLQS